MKKKKDSQKQLRITLSDENWDFVAQEMALRIRKEPRTKISDVVNDLLNSLRKMVYCPS